MRTFSSWGYPLWLREKLIAHAVPPPPTRIFPSWGIPLLQREKLAVLGSCHEFYSSSKRKSSRGRNPIGRGNGGEQWVFLFVKQEILTRKNPRGRGGGDHEDYLIDNDRHSWQFVLFFSLRKNSLVSLFIPEETLLDRKVFILGQETMRITSLTMTGFWTSWPLRELSLNLLSIWVRNLDYIA